jgi:putative flavoprotein involved in K+ transport
LFNMRKTDAVIIGGGQAGLAMSRELGMRGIDHVVLERGRTGERWYSQRWDSLHLLTNVAQSSLPGLAHAGRAAGEFISAGAFGDYLGRYAAHVGAPIVTGADVTAVTTAGGAYVVSSQVGCWRARAVIIATGACDVPYRPAASTGLAPSLHQVDATNYRSPGDLPPGGVLVVGASATGVQLAEELHLSGRPVTLAVGNHTRAPRRYRGRDLYDWLDVAGILDDPLLDGGNAAAARRQPSLQVIGRPDNRDLNLGTLAVMGVRMAGRLNAADGHHLLFGTDLPAAMAASERRMQAMLDRIDGAILHNGFAAPAADPEARRPLAVPVTEQYLDLDRAGIRSVVWATGFTSRYPWLKLPVVDAEGDLIQRGGIVPSPGLFVLGLVFMRRRRSSFINGCARDAEDLAPCIAQHLLGTVPLGAVAARRQAPPPLLEAVG